jgi:hypothetical protein
MAPEDKEYRACVFLGKDTQTLWMYTSTSVGFSTITKAPTAGQLTADLEVTPTTDSSLTTATESPIGATATAFVLLTVLWFALPSGATALVTAETGSVNNTRSEICAGAALRFSFLGTMVLSLLFCVLILALVLLVNSPSGSNRYQLRVDDDGDTILEPCAEDADFLGHWNPFAKPLLNKNMEDSCDIGFLRSYRKDVQIGELNHQVGVQLRLNTPMKRINTAGRTDLDTGQQQKEPEVLEISAKGVRVKIWTTPGEGAEEEAATEVTSIAESTPMERTTDGELESVSLRG